MPVPLDELIACSEGHLDDRDVSRFLLTYERDCGSRRWAGGSAEAFNEVDSIGARQIGLTYASPKPGPWLTLAMERTLFADLRWLVAWLKEISGDLELVFVLRYDDREVGWIRKGVVDDAIREGLIAVWERDLERLERDSPRR
ncbi:hypothetical protein AB0J27_07210 [Micromonospora chokoriensis]